MHLVQFNNHVDDWIRRHHRTILDGKIYLLLPDSDGNHNDFNVSGGSESIFSFRKKRKIHFSPSGAVGTSRINTLSDNLVLTISHEDLETQKNNENPQKTKIQFDFEQMPNLSAFRNGALKSSNETSMR